MGTPPLRLRSPAPSPLATSAARPSSAKSRGTDPGARSAGHASAGKPVLNAGQVCLGPCPRSAWVWTLMDTGSPEPRLQISTRIQARVGDIQRQKPSWCFHVFAPLPHSLPGLAVMLPAISDDAAGWRGRGCLGPQPRPQPVSRGGAKVQSVDLGVHTPMALIPGPYARDVTSGSS